MSAKHTVELTDDRIDFIADTVVKGMPDGIQGFLKAWGWRQFARAILQDCAGHYAPAKEQWQPIETAPKDGAVFLGWVSAERWSDRDGECSSHAHDVSQVDFFWWRTEPMAIDGGYFDNGAGQIGDAQRVAYWMPLPAAPIKERAK